jgi:hypothetical protein
MVEFHELSVLNIRQSTSGICALERGFSVAMGMIAADFSPRGDRGRVGGAPKALKPETCV